LGIGALSGRAVEGAGGTAGGRDRRTGGLGAEILVWEHGEVSFLFLVQTVCMIM